MENKSPTDEQVRPEEVRHPCETEVRLMGRVAVLHGGKPMDLPQSRKVKALLGYLAMSPRPVLRSWLCDFLWDSVSDPRGELRWSLSKLRRVLAETSAALICEGEWVSLDTSVVEVDALRFLNAARIIDRAATINELASVDALYDGVFLGDLRPGLTQGFDIWLGDRRHAVAQAHQSILKRLAELLPVDASDRLHVLRRWIAGSAFDDTAHIELLRSLVSRHETNEAEAHLTATVSHYQQDGIDEGDLLRGWRIVRSEARNVKVCRTKASAGRPPSRTARQPGSGSSLPMVAIAPLASSDPRLAEYSQNLTHDLTIGLARLRAPFVVSENSAFALGEKGFSASEIGRSVNADYLVKGAVRRDRQALRIELELSDVENDRLIWSEEIVVLQVDMPEAANEIGPRITAALAAEIELTECHRALLSPVASLNAWQFHHRGLWHLHRFTAKDNEIAIRFFNQAAALEPTLSRCFAGLSYAHWMNAFAFRPAEKEQELRNAFDAAGRSLHADPKEPAAL